MDFRIENRKQLNELFVVFLKTRVTTIEDELEEENDKTNSYLEREDDNEQGYARRIELGRTRTTDRRFRASSRTTASESAAR